MLLATIASGGVGWPNPKTNTLTVIITMAAIVITACVDASSLTLTLTSISLTLTLTLSLTLTLGLNIVQANRVLFADRWFNPTVHDQDPNMNTSLTPTKIRANYMATPIQTGPEPNN